MPDSARRSSSSSRRSDGLAVVTPWNLLPTDDADHTELLLLQIPSDSACSVVSVG
jgi:hypothetical protein